MTIRWRTGKRIDLIANRKPQSQRVLWTARSPKRNQFYCWLCDCDIAARIGDVCLVIFISTKFVLISKKFRSLFGLSEISRFRLSVFEWMDWSRWLIQVLDIWCIGFLYRVVSNVSFLELFDRLKIYQFILNDASIRMSDRVHGVGYCNECVSSFRMYVPVALTLSALSVFITGALWCFFTDYRWFLQLIIASY